MRLFVSGYWLQVLDSLALVKAVECRKPTVPSKGLAMAQLADTKNFGLVVDCSSTEEVKQATRKLRQNPELLKLLGASKRTVYEREYSWQVIEQRLFLPYPAGTQ